MKSLQQIKDALDALNLTYRTEADGTLITDCPVCALENKGEGKAKVFTDGGFACMRFAGTESAEHKREMLSAWNLETSVKPSAFMCESILDGQLTFEIERGERGRQRVTARNCDSVLHLDTFNLADSSARVKFIKNLNLPETNALTASRTLIDIADRFNRADGAAFDSDDDKEPVLTTFAVLLDGRIIEETTSGFAVYDPSTKETTVQKSVTDEDGTIYKPLINAERADKIGLFLASGVDEYHTEERLDADILNFIEKYVDISEQNRAISSKYARMTYRIDSLNEVPYLHATGNSGNGKSRFTQTVGLLCYRPMFTVGITAAALFRTVDAFHPTLIIDEFNLNASSEDTEAIIQVLNSGYQRLTRIIRCSSKDSNFMPEGFDPFGAKILSGLKATDSQPFTSRTHPVKLEETKRNDIPLQLLPEMLTEARLIRNKLTLWRLRTFNQPLADRLKTAEKELKERGGISKRLIQISVPLYALLDSDEVKDNFVSQLQTRTKDVIDERSQSLDGKLVAIIHSLIFDEDEDGNLKYVEYDAAMVTGQEDKPDERLTTSAITDEINSDLPEKRKHTTDFIGTTLTKMDLKAGVIQRRAAPNYKKRAVKFNQELLSKLFVKYKLPVLAETSVRSVRSEVTPIESDSYLRTLHSEQDNLVFADKPLESKDLTDCEHCEHLISGKQTKEVKEDVFDENLDVEISNFVALDTETEPFNKKLGITPRNAKMIGMSLSYDGQKADYETNKESWNFLMPDDGQTVVLHNAKFDFGVLHRAGLPVPTKFEDTLIAAHLLDENNAHGLKPLSKRHLDIDDPITFEEADRMRLLDPEVFAEYARNDARYTFQLWSKFEAEIDKQELRTVYEMEKNLLPVVMRMETRGMKLDVQSLAAIEREVKAESARLKAEIFDLAGMEFELNKPLSVGAVLFDKLGLKCPKQTAKGARSVDSESLKEIAHPVAVKLLEYRSIDKLANTFIKVLPKFADETGRIHPEFKPLGAATGRFSCADPNVQQVPNKSELGKAIRRAFICEPGNKLIVADFSQMELRVLAHYSQDETLLKAYCSGEETDLHTITAQKMFGSTDVSKEERGIAKMINFGIAYGITDVGLYRRLTATGITTTPKDCKRYISDYFKTYKGVKSFLTKVDKTIRTRGYVKNLFGRRRRLKGATAREIRQAQNFIIQATSADLVKRSMVALSAKLPEGAQLISMVHDELIIECRADHAEDVLSIVKHAMQDTPEGFAVPMPVDAKIVDCWADAK
jgi:DNA polymerase I-like protein with 3'-5' exonuclease and polymerase domains